jgi:hypothetical protein
MKYHNRSVEQRIADALRDMPRVAPAPDLSTRIIASLPSHAAPLPSRGLGAATALVALLGLALAYQTAFDLHSNGALDLLSYYATQPAIVTTYPYEAFDALAQAIPWLTVLLTGGVLCVAFVLVYRWTANARLAFSHRA